LFDTLRLSRTLREKGRFPPEQAEALAKALGEVMQDELATKADVGGVKSDLAAVKAELTAEIGRAEADLKAEIGQVEAGLKAEIGRVEAGLKTDIAVIKARVADLATKAELGDLKADILKWMVGAIGFQTAVIVVRLSRSSESLQSEQALAFAALRSRVVPPAGHHGGPDCFLAFFHATRRGALQEHAEFCILNGLLRAAIERSIMGAPILAALSFKGLRRHDLIINGCANGRSGSINGVSGQNAAWRGTKRLAACAPRAALTWFWG
jgi:hypothetical protein